ncbi:hypothetical protein VPH35_063425 [Triticum aestivum]
MPRRWQVWGRPDSSQVWVPAPAPDAPPPPPPAAAPPLPPPGHAASFEDAPVKDLTGPSPASSFLRSETLGRGAADGCRVESIADLLVQAEEPPVGYFQA